MTALAPQSPAPQAAAVSGLAHYSPTWSGGRVRNRRDRQRAARCFAGPDPARAVRTTRSRRPEDPFKALSSRTVAEKSAPNAALAPEAGSGHGTAESP